MKIDTEGHDFEVILGLGKKIKKCKLIWLEHHDDSSIIKKNTFKEMNDYLENNHFIQKSRLKMLLRNSYELIYVNKELT